jgi:hypothetical protein
MAFVAIAAGVGAGAAVASAIGSTSDVNKRRLYAQNLGLLDFDQKKKLNDALLATNSEAARQQLLADVLGKVNTARVDALGKLAQEKEKTKKTLITVAIIAGSVLTLGLLLVFYKRGKK